MTTASQKGFIMTSVPDGDGKLRVIVVRTEDFASPRVTHKGPELI